MKSDSFCCVVRCADATAKSGSTVGAGGGLSFGNAMRRALQLSRMDEMDDIRRCLRVSNLEARRELIEIQRTALLREITSPLTSQDCREQAYKNRDELMIQSAEVVAELHTLPR